MKNRLISLFAVLLAFAALATAFVSCKKTSDPAQDGTASDTVTGEQSQAPEGSEELLLRPEKKSFDRKYTMLVKENEFYQHLYTWDSEERPKEIMDVACWQRQTYLAENYGIELVVANQGSNAAAMLANDCAAGSNLYDVAFLSGNDTLAAAANGYLYDLNTLRELNLSASYYDQRIQEEYLIGERLFTLEGDFSYRAQFGVSVIVYNDRVYNQMGYMDTYGSPYELASKNQWTYEVLLEMIRDRSYDMLDENVQDENDFWGMLADSGTPYCLYMASGIKNVTNVDGELILCPGGPVRHGHRPVRSRSVRCRPVSGSRRRGSRQHQRYRLYGYPDPLGSAGNGAGYRQLYPGEQPGSGGENLAAVGRPECGHSAGGERIRDLQLYPQSVAVRFS